MSRACNGRWGGVAILVGALAVSPAGCVDRARGAAVGQGGSGGGGVGTGLATGGMSGSASTRGSSDGVGSSEGHGTGSTGGTAGTGATGSTGTTGASGDTVGTTGEAQAPPWSTVTAGSDHTCAVFADGTLWCWGRNDGGQLGIDVGNDPVRPAPVQVGDASSWAQVAAARTHTCALRQDGTAWCWGDGSRGQLGTPGLSMAVTPIQVGTDTDWAWITSRGSHTCGMRSDGSAWCWGANGSGQIGDGTSGEDQDRSAPVPIAPGVVWHDLSAGGFHTCGIRDDRSLWCWGDNVYGQVGDGTYDLRPLPVPLGVGNDWVQVMAGTLFSCALRTDGTVWCWGQGEWGQLGNGQKGWEATRNTPNQVGSDDDWGRLGLGEFHACAIRQDGSLWCWGYDVMVVHRDNSGTILPDPVPMGEDLDWAFAYGGGAHTCGLRKDLSLWCWGDSNSGAVGSGEIGDQVEMTPIAP